jgi:hypothetical protein
MDWLSLAEQLQESQQELLKKMYVSPEEKMKACLHVLRADYDKFFEIGMRELPMLSDAWP